MFCYRSAADLYSFFGPFLLFGLLGGSLGPICLYLLKPLCRRTVFCSRSVFCYRFVICCRSAFGYRSAADLYSFFGPFLLFSLLGGPLGLGFYWAFFLMGFWIWIRKNGHQQSFYIKATLSCLQQKKRKHSNTMDK